MKKPYTPGPVLSRDISLGISLFTVLLCALFGANAVAMKISLSGLGVFTNIFLRFSISSLTILLWARWRGWPIMVANRRQARQITVVSLIFFCQMSGMYLGQNLTTASHGTLIANLLPFVVMLLAHLFLKDERMQLKKAAGLLLGFSGVLLLFLDTAHAGASSWQGDSIIFLAVLLWGCNVVFIKRIIADFHPVQITVLPMLLNMPLFFAAALIFDKEMISTLSPPVIAALLYQGLVTASFGFIMWNTLIQRYGATALHSFIFIVPISGVTFGVLLLGEPFTMRLAGAILLVSAALIVVNYRFAAKITKRG